MQRLLNYILLMVSCAILASCSDDTDLPERDVHFCIRAEWMEGRSMPQTRTVSEGFKTALLATETTNLVIPTSDYPESIQVKSNDNTTQFSLTKGAPCSQHDGFVVYNGNSVKAGDLSSLTATAILDGEELSGTATTKDDHIQFALHHTKALLRFAFKVSAEYDRIRQVKVTDITLNGIPCTLVEKVLNTSRQLIAYGYIDPAVVTTDYQNTIRCTYNIYDKDEASVMHITREGVTAENKIKLESLKDASNTHVAQIRAGYYYDLNITLNPDYLYVLSDHDNKHMTIE